MLDKRIINTATGAAAACTTDTVQILDGAPFESVATYQLDGNATDSTTNGYNGTWSGTAAYGAGKFGDAAVFNGVNLTYVKLPSAVDTILNTKNFGLSLWVKAPNAATDAAFSTETTNSTFQIHANWAIANRYALINGGGSEIDLGPIDSSWHHIVVTSDGSSSYKGYFDGVYKGTVPYRQTSNVGTFLGAHPGGGFNLVGEIDQVRIFNTALSAGAVTNLYNETLATASNTYINLPSLVAYYKMSDATDETGSYDGTPTDVNFNVAGKFGNAGEFNGSSSGIDLPSLTNSYPFTVSAWINTSDFPSNTFSPIVQQNIAGQRITIGSTSLWNPNQIAIAFGGTSQFSTDANSITSNQWTHIVACFRASTDFDFYINGSAANVTNNGGNHGGTAANALGYNGLSTEWFNGSIDQVRIFDRTITANEAETLYNEVQCVPTIVPASNFETVIYDGNGGTKEITSLDFQPDFVWIKERNNTGTDSHRLFDVIRGATWRLYSNSTSQQSQSTDSLTSFDSNGFTLGSEGGVNGNNSGYVAWCWKAADTTTTIAANTVGNTIASDVRANTEAGFSIVKYITPSGGAGTVGHGLSSAPEVYITKRLDSPSDWYFNTNAIDGSLDYLILNSTAIKTDSSGISLPTSTVFNASNFGSQNEQWITYCFHSVSGMSDIGSYVGTGATGNTIVTGFRPAFVMWKAAVRPSGGGSWYMYDNKRTTSNPQGQYLQANESAQEFDGTSVFNMEFNSNGFTINATNNEINQSGSTYIFLAFAEEAFNPNGVTRNTTDPFGDGSEVALYKFEDNASDAEGNYDGVDTNVTYSAGYIDKAAVFNGSSSIIYVNSFDTTTNFSISLWFKTSSSNYQVLANNGGGEGANTGFLWYLNTSGNIVLATSSGGGNFNGTPTTSAYNDGNWHNAVLSYASNGVYSIYVDNQLVVSETSSRYTGALVFGRPFAIGAWTQLNQWWFNGSIDQVRIFDGALDSGEVAQLYNE